MSTTNLSRPAVRLAMCAAFFTLLSLNPFLLGAQQADEQPVVVGRVLDAGTGAPVVGAYVRSLTRDGGVLTDEQGAFRLRVRDEPLHYVSVTQIGYGESEAAISAEDAAVPVDIMIEPDPIAMEEISVFHDRYGQRRNRYAGRVQSIEGEDLYLSGANTAYDLVLRNAHIVPCGVTSCAYRRGRKVPVDVWIDERPMWGDLDWLDGYAIEDLYLVEIFDRGQMVRLYTREAVRRNPQRLSALAILPAERNALAW